MEKEIKALNDSDFGRVSGGETTRSNLKDEGISECFLCHKKFSYSYFHGDPKALDKKKYCNECRLKKVKAMLVGS